MERERPGSDSRHFHRYLWLKCFPSSGERNRIFLKLGRPTYTSQFGRLFHELNGRNKSNKMNSDVKKDRCVYG